MFKLNSIFKKFTSNDFLKKVSGGFLIGIAAVTPGLSGGVIAATYGIYEPIIKALINLKKSFKKSFYFLVPLGIGAAIGILLFGTILESLMAYALNEVLFVFIGLIAGNIPSLVKDANNQGFKKRYLIAFAISFFVLLSCEYVLPGSAKVDSADLGAVNSVISGIIVAAGTIIPGLSSSVVLIKFGFYEQLLSAITRFDFFVCFFAGIGFVLSALIFVKLADITFRRYHGYAYYAVLGFLASSVIIVFPEIQSGIKLLLDIVLVIASFVLSLFISRRKR